MKFKFIYTVFSLSLLALVFMSNENGRADSQGKGNTGAPGDETVGATPRTCVSCHNSSTTIQMTLGIEVLDASGTSIDKYTPGQTYRVRVTNEVASGNPMGYGFQVVCLEAPEGENGANEATFSNPASNVKIAIASSNGRQYAEHNGMSDTNVFEVDWTAPELGTGPVTFYSCGNAVNDNNMNSGDGAACNVLELAEDTSSSTFEIQSGVKIFLYPNPVQDEMKVQLISDVSAEFNMEIFDMQGRLKISKVIDLNAGENLYFYNVDNLNQGTYLVKFSNEDKTATAKLLKL
jgi:type IX secretion system substrate protein/Reeler domain-containing protein